MFIPYVVTFLSHIFLDNVRLGTGTWQITEILINYQGDFVRRGLIGEVISLLSTVVTMAISIPINYLLLQGFFVLYKQKKSKC